MKAETKWAIIASIAMLAWMFIAQALGFLTPEKFATGQMAGMLFSTLLFIVVYFMATREKRDRELNGVMSWAEGFWAAARMTLIYIPISSILFLFYSKFINPDYLALLASNNYDKDPVNALLFGNLQSALLFGGLFCLVFPLFTRKSL